MLEYLALGAIQGLVEWLPLSSEAWVTLGASYFGMANPIQLALYLHLGTALAVIVYFRKEVSNALALCDRKLARFLAIATVCSGLVGLPLYLALKSVPFDSKVGFLLVGAGLIATGAFLHKRKGGLKTVKTASDRDAIFAGLLQGLAVVPGISRSGITMFSLLFQEFSPEAALSLSFLMSVPVVLMADVFMAYEGFMPGPGPLVALGAAFVFGIASMRALLAVAKRVNFSWFAWMFGALSLLAWLLV